MQDGALDNALETQRGLRVDLLAAHHRGVLVDEVVQQLPQLLHVRGARAQDLCRRGVVQHGEQQMLHGYEFVALLPGLHERHVQTDF
ncbi:hypothetical protein D3C83_58450 [compost metagenome]